MIDAASRQIAPGSPCCPDRTPLRWGTRSDTRAVAMTLFPMDKILVVSAAAATALALGACSSKPPSRITVAPGLKCDELEALEPGLGAFCARGEKERRAEGVRFRLVAPKTHRTLFSFEDADVTLDVDNGRVTGAGAESPKYGGGTLAERQAEVRALAASLAAARGPAPRAWRRRSPTPAPSTASPGPWARATWPLGSTTAAL
ncbi:MAG: hypothetical protein U1F43_35285 [Myxococcota bacterium]